LNQVYKVHVYPHAIWALPAESGMWGVKESARADSAPARGSEKDSEGVAANEPTRG
jgi:hypothetical protein